MTCKYRVPDHTDFIDCGHYSGDGDYCWRHMTDIESALIQKLADTGIKMSKLKRELWKIRKQKAKMAVVKKGSL